MIDKTLSTSLYLWRVNRDRELMTVRMQGQRQAFWLTCAIVFFVTVGVIAWILQ